MPPPVLFDNVGPGRAPVSGPLAWEAAWELLALGPQTRTALVTAMVTCAGISGVYALRIVQRATERGFLTVVSRDASDHPTYVRAEL